MTFGWGIRVLIKPATSGELVAAPHPKGLRSIGRGIVVYGFLCICVATCLAMSEDEKGRGSGEGVEVAVENAGAPVEVDGRPILLIYARIGGFTPQERAEAITQRITSLGKNRSIPVESIHAENRGTWTEILAGKDRIMGITEADALGAERGRADLASEYTEIIRQVVKQYRDDHTLARIIREPEEI